MYMARLKRYKKLMMKTEKKLQYSVEIFVDYFKYTLLTF